MKLKMNVASCSINQERQSMTPLVEPIQSIMIVVTNYISEVEKISPTLSFNEFIHKEHLTNLEWTSTLKKIQLLHN
jgi:hypothetical protein